jgi:transcriptional regulator with XRE-family HTH domain
MKRMQGRPKPAKPVPVKIDRRAIGRRIREIRGFDLTQIEFAKLLGIDQTQLSRYEKGRTLPPTEMLLKLRTYSGRSIDWILTGKNVITEPGAP